MCIRDSTMARELRKNVTEVESQRDKLEIVLHNMTDGVLAFDENGILIHANKICYDMLEIDDAVISLDWLLEKLSLDRNYIRPGGREVVVSEDGKYISVAPVSYTHLGVYKRQVLTIPVSGPTVINVTSYYQSEFTINGAAGAVAGGSTSNSTSQYDTVSYTTDGVETEVTITFGTTYGTNYLTSIEVMPVVEFKSEISVPGDYDTLKDAVTAIKSMNRPEGEEGRVTVSYTHLDVYKRQIYESVPREKITIFLKRAMLKAAEKIALENGDLALVTGDSIGQVASQTMEAINAIDLSLIHI